MVGDGVDFGWHCSYWAANLACAAMHASGWLSLVADALKAPDAKIGRVCSERSRDVALPKSGASSSESGLAFNDAGTPALLKRRDSRTNLASLSSIEVGSRLSAYTILLLKAVPDFRMGLSRERWEVVGIDIEFELDIGSDVEKSGAPVRVACFLEASVNRG